MSSHEEGRRKGRKTEKESKDGKMKEGRGSVFTNHFLFDMTGYGTNHS